MQQKSFFLLIAIVVSICTQAKEVDTTFFQQKESMLLELHARISKASGNNKQVLEKTFQDSLLHVVQYPGATDFRFDSAKVFGRIISSDEKLIIYSWNIPQQGGFHNYYCILQYYIKKEKRYNTVVLNEKIGFLSQNAQGFASADNWPGSLYYQAIPSDFKGGTDYTLFGFDFNNLVSNRKIIERIRFDEAGNVSFVSNGFVYEGKPVNRVVFEYNERVQMRLDLNPVNGMIVFDHLSPMKPSLQGQYQFYGPDLSYDGFVLEDGVWVHHTNIEL